MSLIKVLTNFTTCPITALRTTGKGSEKKNNDKNN